MPRKDTRRHQRISYLGPVRISWMDENNAPQFAQGKCVDASEGGLRVEILKPIPVYSVVSLRADQANLGGSAIVKHIARSGSKYIVGLELSQAVSDGLSRFGSPEDQKR